ncbi:MAG: PilZ domain-containing protein [Candidatus Omnitrophica bacterium]|nr:PilZ domain-containing protein [Candidatus Omnitrophota bacterium]
MEIRKRFSKNIAVLYLAGKIDINSAEFIEETGRLLREGIEKILCDFSNVEVVDYNGLSILSIAYKNIINRKGVLKFSNVPQHIRQLFKAARLDMVFELCGDEESAIKSFDLSSKVDRLSLRRRFERIDVNITLRYKIGVSGDAKLSRGKVLNLSGDGLFVHSKNIFPLSTELYMEIGFPRYEKPLTVTGSVIWIADKELQPHSYPGMGIEFRDIDKCKQTKIIDFIDKNLTRRSSA